MNNPSKAVKDQQDADYRKYHVVKNPDESPIVLKSDKNDLRKDQACIGTQ